MEFDTIVEKRFVDYTNSVIDKNEKDRDNFDLKVEHTYRVRDNMTLLIKNMGLDTLRYKIDIEKMTVLQAPAATKGSVGPAQGRRKYGP